MDDESLPEWLGTEAAVSSLFALFGFEIQHISIHGRQIDLIATKNDAFALEPEVWAIEITIERVGVDKGAKDSQKLLLAREEGKCNRMMLVSTAGFTDDQKVSLQKLGIVCKTYNELERQFIDLDRYAAVTIREREQPPESDIGFDPKVFVDPTVRVQRSMVPGTPTLQLSATAWVQELCRSPAGVVGALLGSLGSGKTSVLQRVQLALLREYVKSPSSGIVPIYIPLARYKYHSGRMQSLIQEVLSEAGINNYPATLVKHLCWNGRVVLLLDGLDEVHPIQSADDLISTVSLLLSYLGKDTRAIISSRSHLFATSDEELAMFGPYERHQLDRVSTEIGKLLSGRAKSEIAHIQPFTPDQIKDYLSQACGSDVGAVSTYIDSMYGFKDMASTPVLLAMMRNTLPELIRKGHEFSPFPQLDLYEQYTNRWITRDQGRAQLSPTQRLHISKILATALIKRAEYAARWSEIREKLIEDESWEANPISDGAAEMDVRNSTFLIREGADHFRFVHRSIMEYFTAVDSYERITSGARSDLTLSSGHAIFLSLILAKNWLRSDGHQPFPRTDLNVNEWFDAEYLGIISAATKSLPKEHAGEAVLTVRVKGDKADDFAFANATLRQCSFRIVSINRLAFAGCRFESTEIEAKRIGRLELENYTAKTSSISLDSNSWKAVKVYPAEDHGVTTLSLPGGFAAAARWVEHTECLANIDGSKWIVPYRCFTMLAALSKRLMGRGKINIDTWTHGAYGPELQKLLPKLIASKFVDEDTSRSPHQLSLSAKGGTIIKGVRAEPQRYMVDLLRFDPEQA